MYADLSLLLTVRETFFSSESLIFERILIFFFFDIVEEIMMRKYTEVGVDRMKNSFVYKGKKLFQYII